MPLEKSVGTLVVDPAFQEKDRDLFFAQLLLEPRQQIETDI